MNNLKQGILEINKVLITPNCRLNEVILEFNKDDIKIIKVDDETTVVRLLAPVKIGTKSFGIGIFFENEVIWSIDLKVADPSINEWDYKEMLAQHGDWLVEQIGHPAGILSENVYEWGKITQWDDPRSCTAGISIVYFQK
ncbi:hypothetical protein CN326_04080 [Bacillus sp. AFS018417]|uniref:hypothetical protein n=1 Tax=unclassified Bacillus (in: firmicutes) TaxID=185979 RepID=UPI000BF29FC8|nr:MULTISPECIES: hypothetical protein [unclassified Bacillus (in: firmicutes)]MCP1125731.1 hypothetical protein [Bacillus sp. 3103sda1]PEZ08858.1 hypothetical protein CN326_04080 [Bacillus sp. AFS018417]